MLELLARGLCSDLYLRVERVCFVSERYLCVTASVKLPEHLFKVHDHRIKALFEFFLYDPVHVADDLCQFVHGLFNITALSRQEFISFTDFFVFLNSADIDLTQLSEFVLYLAVLLHCS